jgi:hypothetical protein
MSIVALIRIDMSCQHVENLASSEGNVDASTLLKENDILRKQLLSNMEETAFKLKLAEEKEQVFMCMF